MRIKLTAEDILIDNSWDFSKKVTGFQIECGEHNEKDAQQLKQQILDDNTIITEFDKGAWKGVIEYIRDAKVSRGKLIGENLLMFDKIEQIRKLWQNKPPKWVESMYKLLEEK